jgi:hypothetical protein
VLTELVWASWIAQESVCRLLLQVSCHVKTDWTVRRRKADTAVQRSKAEEGRLKDDLQQLHECFKMKILACLLRQNRKRFFRKRGTSCLGFAIITNGLSVCLHGIGRWTQDAQMVISAKYNCVLALLLLRTAFRFVYMVSDDERKMPRW